MQILSSMAQYISSLRIIIVFFSHYDIARDTLSYNYYEQNLYAANLQFVAYTEVRYSIPFYTFPFYTHFLMDRVSGRKLAKSYWMDYCSCRI